MNSDGCSVEVDCVNEEQWHDIIANFCDATIYQTWSYGAVRFGEDRMSHLMVRRNDIIIGAAQVRIVKIPLIGAGIGYVRWGPMWRRNKTESSVEDFRETIRALWEEYVDRRGLYLRVIPNEVEDPSNGLRSVLEGAGFEWGRSDYQTLFLDLSANFEEIRNSISRSWKKNLIRAEKRGLEILEGTDQGLFEIVNRLYWETVSRKKFVPGIDIDEYRNLQCALPSRLKMRIMVCQSEGKPIAGLIGSAMGDIGIELIAATGAEGLELGGSYILRWKMVEYLKKCGCQFYNLNGINPEKNPGGYQFKLGLCGKNGKELMFLGQFDACRNPLSQILFKRIYSLRDSYRDMRRNMAKRKRKDEGAHDSKSR
jgi:hypothetical protein